MKYLAWMQPTLAVCGSIALQAALLPAQAQTPAGAPQAMPAPRPQILFTTTAFQDGGVIPDKYTAAATTAVSPALHWTQTPAGTQSFVLLVHDPEPALNKSSTVDVTHWLVWNIPATTTDLPEGVPVGDRPDGMQQVSMRSSGYQGPGAPAGGPYHHYTFELFALDTKITVPTGKAEPDSVAATRKAVFDAMDGHVLGKALLVGRFHR